MTQTLDPLGTEGGPDSIQLGIRRIGELVMLQRMRKNISQSKLAAQLNFSRNTLAHLEQGRRLPTPAVLERIGRALKLQDDPHWRVLTHPQYLTTIRFQEALAELLGKPLSLDSLDPISQAMLIESVSSWIHPEGAQMSLTQAHDHFNTLLTFYGERGVSRAFYQSFLGQRNFTSVAHFLQRVRHFQQTAIRIYGSFRKAFKTLSLCDEQQLAHELRSLQPIDPSTYAQRRPFNSIQLIARERLDDLGYISAERVKQQNRERHELRRNLQALANWIEQSPDHSISGFAVKKLHRIQTLLRTFESDLQIEETLFTQVDPLEIRREAQHLSPEDDDLAQIAETQERGLQNLTAYLTEPYLDVYIATSMRERADFISVNTFVEALFSNPLIAPLHLRYFNPTLSWISDRVAKGLVEALMLRRASLTIYMAQKSDTFGKDSEASVALGQGKPVIVYVPRLYAPAYQLDSESLMQQSEGTLRQQLLSLNTELDDDLDKQGLVGKVLSARLHQLSPLALAEIIESHWADFDLYGEMKSLSAEHSARCNNWLDALTLRHEGEPLPLPPLEICGILIDKLVQVALFFERRAHTFKEIHPLALQVILSSGVLNGILVVRSAESCTQCIYHLLTNTLQTDLKVEPDNYRLIEKQTGSTLRVISRHQLLTHAFWTQYFS